MYTLLKEPTSEHFTLSLKGSKSYMNRALVMAALNSNTTTLYNPSDSSDSVLLIEALKKLGVTFKSIDKQLKITSPKDGLHAVKGKINVGPAGTTMRFLTALLAAIADTDVELSGTERMHERPIEMLVSALDQLGSKIDYLGKAGCPPLRIRGQEIFNNTVTMPGNVSSQFFTALLLCSPLFKQGLELEVLGEQVSKSYIEMTLAIMKSAGVEVENQEFTRYLVSAGSSYNFKDILVEGDASGATYFWGLAALSGQRIRVENISSTSLQGDAKFPLILEQMGCTVGNDSNSITVTGPKTQLKAVNVNMEQMPDSAQTLATIAAFADGTTNISGLQTLRIKETDRIAAVQAELSKMGIDSQSTQDSLTIFGGRPKAAQIETYEDHRMAMSFAIMAAKVDGLCIFEPEVVNKSFPDFWKELKRAGIASQ